MKLNKKALNDALNVGDKEVILKECEPIIYWVLHQTGFWNKFPSLREDFLQEGRIAVLYALDNWDKTRKAQFTTFATLVIRSKLFSYYYKMKWYQNESFSELNDERHEKSYDMKPLTLYDTLIEEMEKDENATALKLFYIDEYTQDEVAKMVGMSQQWVGNIVIKFKKEMRKKYGKMFGINTHNESILEYNKKTNEGLYKFKINGIDVYSNLYNDHKRTYMFFDKYNRVIAEIGDCDKMSILELRKKFGD